MPSSGRNKAGKKGTGKGKGPATDDEAEESEDSEEMQVRHLGQDEDLVIDGETAVDDLLVAQRIAEQESFVAEQVQQPDGIDAGSSRKKKPPSSADVQKLLRLLRETSKLTAKIGELPEQFDAVVGEDVREACRAAAEAVTKLPVPEPSEDAPELEDCPVGEESWGSGAEDPEEALAAVDLQSTDEEEERDTMEGTEEVQAVAEEDAEAEVQAGEAGGAEDEDEGQGDDIGGAPERPAEDGDGTGPNGEDASMLRVAREDEPGAPVIDVSKLPDKLSETDTKEPVGHVQSNVQGLLVVQGEEDGKALDLHSVVCLEDGRVLGAVVDVFGPVTLPHYLVLASPNVKDPPSLGAAVFAATSLEETSFLCDTANLAELQRLGAGEDSGDEDSEAEASDQDEEDDGWGPVGAAVLEAAERGVWAPPAPEPGIKSEVKEEKAIKIEAGKGGMRGGRQWKSKAEETWHDRACEESSFGHGGAGPSRISSANSRDSSRMNGQTHSKVPRPPPAPPSASTLPAPPPAPLPRPPPAPPVPRSQWDERASGYGRGTRGDSGNALPPPPPVPPGAGATSSSDSRRSGQDQSWRRASWEDEGSAHGAKRSRMGDWSGSRNR